MTSTEVSPAWRCLMAAALAAFVCSGAAADLVYLQDGRVIEGEVRDRGNAYAVRTKTGMTIEVRKDEVLKIEKTESPLQAYEKKLKSLAPDDAKGHYELARWCLENKFEREAAHLLGQLAGMASPHLKDAKLKLGDLLARSDPKRAIKLYEDVAFRFKDADASIKARDLRRNLEARQAMAFENGMQALAAGKLSEAKSEFERAYSLTAGSAGRGVTEAAVLEKLAETRAKIEGTLAAPGEAGAGVPVEFCGQCPECSGWTSCYKCSGKGTVERVIPAHRTILGEPVPEQRVQDPCPVCHGAKVWRCQGCAGTTISLSNQPKDVQEQIKSLGNVAHGRDHEDFITACLTMNDQVRSLRLRLQQGVKPRYGPTQPIRDEIKALPVDRDFAKTPEVQKVRAPWKKLRTEQRALFLCGYALELTQTDMATQGQAGPPAAPADNVDLKSLKFTSAVVSATELSAIPEEHDGEWVLTWVLYRGKDEKFSTQDQIVLKVGNEQFSNLHPFVFGQKAKSAHEQLSRGRQGGYYKALLSQYDYAGMQKRVESLAEGDRIQLLGRMQARPGKSPENLLEVWSIDVRMNAEDEKLLTLVRKPVTFNFTEMPIADAVTLLAALCDTRITANLPPNARVALSGRAVRQPLGLALRALLKDAKLTWVFDGDSGVRIVQDPPASDAEKADRIVRRLE